MKFRFFPHILRSFKSINQPNTSVKFASFAYIIFFGIPSFQTNSSRSGVTPFSMLGSNVKKDENVISVVAWYGRVICVAGFLSSKHTFLLFIYHHVKGTLELQTFCFPFMMQWKSLVGICSNIFSNIPLSSNRMKSQSIH